MSARRTAKVVYAIWYREMVRFMRDRGQWLGLVIQPLLYLLLVGEGISNSMTFRGASNLSYLTFMYPGIVGMSVLFTSVFSGVGIIWDREFGFLKEVLVAPVARWAVAAGKSLAIATIVVIQAAVLLILAPLAHVPLTLGSALGILGVCAVLGFALGSLGIAIGSRMQSMQGFQFVMNMLVMPLFFLSGALYPLRGLPTWLNALAKIDPLTYGIDALRNVVYAGGQGARLLVQYSIGLDLTVVVVVAAVLVVIGAWAFQTQQ